MILVTGGAGYVGSVLVKYFLENNLNIRVYDKFYFGRDHMRAKKGRLEMVEGDIVNFDPVIFENIKYVIHLAGLSNDPTADFNPDANFRINTDSTIELAKYAKKRGVKRFIFASSCSIYDRGELQKTFMKTERSKVKPEAYYSLSKRRAEKGILKLADSKFGVVVLRKGTVFGFSPRMRYDLVVNTMIKDALSKNEIKIFGQGLHWRPLVDVRDVARAYLLAVKAPINKVNGSIFNIIGGNFLIRELAVNIQEILGRDFGKKPKVTFIKSPNKIRSYKVGGLAAQEILGFKPQITLEESIIKLVREIKKGKNSDFANPLYYNIDWMKPILEKEFA